MAIAGKGCEPGDGPSAHFSCLPINKLQLGADTPNGPPPQQFMLQHRSETFRAKFWMERSSFVGLCNELRLLAPQYTRMWQSILVEH